MKKKTLVCIDRDGTLIHDSREHLFLGSRPDWKKKVEVLPGIVEGLKVLRQLPEAKIYMITNQSGVALKDYPLLTEEKAHEVCRYVMKVLEGRGIPLDGYFLCPHVDEDYVKKHPEREFEQEMVCECSCIKPRLGMVFDALESEGITRQNVNLYVVGDRASDAHTASNAGGTGILVPYNEPDEGSRLRDGEILKKSFPGAARFVLEQES